jgi:hypothetical protein
MEVKGYLSRKQNEDAGRAGRKGLKANQQNRIDKRRWAE